LLDDFSTIQPDFILTIFPETPDPHYSYRFVAKSPESGFLVERISFEDKCVWLMAYNWSKDTPIYSGPYAIGYTP